MQNDHNIFLSVCKVYISQAMATLVGGGIGDEIRAFLGVVGRGK